MEHELKEIIKKCDLAIKKEDFDTLMNYYTDDAILVVKPGMIARGKEEIKQAFIAIAKYFNNSLIPNTGENDYFRSRRHCVSYFPNAT